MATHPVLRLAIAMNNIGTSLLEKHCYHQALEILKDGVTLVDGLFANETSSPSLNLELTMHKYRQAEQLYQRVKHETSDRIEICSRRAAAADLVVVSTSNKSEFVRNVLGPDISNKNRKKIDKLFPMRIEDIGIFQDNRTEKDFFALCLLILIHNYGISQFCVAYGSCLFQNPKTCMWSPRANAVASLASRSCYMSSIQLIRLALEAYSHQISRRGISKVEYCDFLCDIAFVLNSLIVAYSYNGKQSEVNVYWSMLDQVWKQIQNLAGSNLLVDSSSIHGAAPVA